MNPNLKAILEFMTDNPWFSFFVIAIVGTFISNTIVGIVRVLRGVPKLRNKEDKTAPVMARWREEKK